MELFKVSRVFLQIPWKYSGGVIVGKEYKATKDYLKWNNLDVKEWTPVIQSLAIEWIKHIPKKS